MRYNRSQQISNTTEEVKTNVMRMKNGRSPDPGGVSVELLIQYRDVNFVSIIMIKIIKKLYEDNVSYVKIGR